MAQLEYGKKHIARLQRRILALEARFKASPGQADFDSERAEVKSLKWAIQEIEREHKRIAGKDAGVDSGGSEG